MANPSGSSLLVIERLLRDRDGIWRQIIEERDLKQLTLQMLISSTVSLALYGAVLGASNGALQAVSSFVKLPLLFLATLAICLPTLYLFNLVFGAKLSVLQALTLIMVTITVTAVLTLAFAPISLFFLITAQSYLFFKLLNVGILVLTAIVGLRFLTAGMRALNDHQERVAHALAAPPAAVPAAEPEPALVGAAVAAGPEAPARENGSVTAFPPGVKPLSQIGHRPPPVELPPGERPASMTLLHIWILLFGFVGTQLAWTLRPFFGSPDKPFQLFRSIGGTFYADIVDTIGRLLGA
ncbi:hypothetical protein [Actinoplanes sp. DH11]|uniref:hypothetical protein n=1 Tax=Actinoplanes sp. DH11 TaxID=2857011 RepID=UPI001E3A1C81|nr:hypothetical protein [Actinoplanes sp. DH11]